jgi:hypothetical protein
MERQSYPSDVSDEEWAFMVPYLTLMREDAPQREHDLQWLRAIVSNFLVLRLVIDRGRPCINRFPEDNFYECG